MKLHLLSHRCPPFRRTFGLMLITALFSLLLSCRAKAPVSRFELSPDLAGLHCTATEPEPNTLLLSDEKTQIRFVAGSALVLINDVPLRLNSPVEKVNGVWVFPDGNAREVLFPLLHPEPRKIKTILLDPGHGGKDTGAKGTGGILEKNLNLSLALALEKELKKAGFQVKMTRKEDHFIELGARGSQTAAAGADLFISIHHNAAAANPDACGVECFIIAPAKEKAGSFVWMSRSIRLAFLIQQGQKTITGNSGRGVKFAGFRVLKDASCPAVLVEAGFLSNAKEEKWCADPRNQAAFARVITQAVLSYAGL